ncbi:MAG: PD-(D/E)XK nuclease family protein [Candidatus Poseidoniaceae archaeon]|nr:PD-(D/E)XK nuclease family protein [Candidatus Poseidoniaceae archaeon]
MPATIVDQDNDVVGPYNRLSASQVNSFQSCPRLWFYEKNLHFKFPQVPVLFVGRAVEDAFCRMLRESPGLISSNASHDTISRIPLDGNGQPDRNSDEVWPSQRILPLPDKLLPKSISDIRDWAISRIDAHLPVSLEEMRIEWNKDERKAGDWSDVDPNYCREMCINGIDMHLKELESCMENIDENTLKLWRNGHREEWPSPDGFGFSLEGTHPLANNSKITLLEAWEISRPWFVDPDAANFSLNAIHPDFWFQGEYDLVYRWNGRIKIVDLKASLGKGDRSGDYVKQLRMYAMLWWVTHEKKELVSDLEVWYLGANKVKIIDNPTESELEEMEKELNLLWKELKSVDISIENFPPSPSPVRGFLEGGVKTDPPSEKRCDRCDWSKICPGGSGNDEFPADKSFTVPGNITPIEVTPINDLDPRLTIVCDVFSVFDSKNKRPSITISQGKSMAKIDILVDKHQDGQRPWPEQISKGDRIMIENAVVTVNWKGELVLKIDPLGMISKTQKEIVEHSDLMEFRARWNVVGKMIYKFDKKGVGRNGKQWHRKGIMIMDPSGSMKISGWANDWGTQYDMSQMGDLVLIANTGIDAWATQVRGDISRNSKIQIISSTR